jgi:GNAT superfamily N-acetyltransferase
MRGDSMSQCFWLTADQASGYSHLTTKSLALVLASVNDPNLIPGTRRTLLFAAGQVFAGSPAALAVVKEVNIDEWEVISLAVTEPYRGMRLATNLLDWLGREARHRNISVLSLSYPLIKASTAAMARLTAPQKGWQLSEGLRLVGFDRTGGLAMLEKLAPLSARWLRSRRLTVVRWQALTSHQHRQLQVLERHAPQWAWPTQQDASPFAEQRDELVSNVLLDHGQAIGWLIADQVHCSLIRVTKWWVKQQWQGTGCSLVMVHQAIADMLARKPSYKSLCFGVSKKSEAMIQLSTRHLEPFACSVQRNQRASLKLYTDG